MRYVLLTDVLETFVRYIKDNDKDLMSKETAIEELKDALESARYIDIES